jgi:ribosomal protein S18 acetylase RimI-like enzyme
MMIKISEEFNENIFSQIIELWEITAIANPERADKYLNIVKTLKHGGKLFSIIYNKQIIATSWVTHDFRRAYIHHMAVHPKYQNQAYGSIILAKALEYCKTLGLQAKLEVHQHNYHAQTLYKKQGFKLLDGYQVYIKRDIK